MKRNTDLYLRHLSDFEARIKTCFSHIDEKWNTTLDFPDQKPIDQLYNDFVLLLNSISPEKPHLTLDLIATAVSHIQCPNCCSTFIQDIDRTKEMYRRSRADFEEAVRITSRDLKLNGLPRISNEITFKAWCNYIALHWKTTVSIITITATVIAIAIWIGHTKWEKLPVPVKHFITNNVPAIK